MATCFGAVIIGPTDMETLGQMLNLSGPQLSQWVHQQFLKGWGNKLSKHMIVNKS